MTDQTVLISGAGIAGSTLAYWLAEHGFRPTVVERAPLRAGGSPVDVKGEAVTVAEQMGVMARLRDADTGMTGLTFVNAAGRRVGRISRRALQRNAASREAEVPRGDLVTVLHEAAKDRAEYLWSDSITSIDQDAGGVAVSFEHTEPRRFDFVVGADGLHSTVRRLVFGPEADHVRHMGMYVATLPLRMPPERPTEVVMYNAPGRAVSISPTRTRAIGFFAFRAPLMADLDLRDTDRCKLVLGGVYGGDAWRVPDLLDEVKHTGELYFDSVSQVRLLRWCEGRVALLGDAASCVSLFGDGSTLAMIGAFRLAAELAASPGDHGAAFERYEANQRKLVEPRQRDIKPAAGFIVPATKRGIVIRNVAASALSPVLTAIGSLRR